MTRPGASIATSSPEGAQVPPLNAHQHPPLAISRRQQPSTVRSLRSCLGQTSRLAALSLSLRKSPLCRQASSLCRPPTARSCLAVSRTRHPFHEQWPQPPALRRPSLAARFLSFPSRKFAMKAFSTRSIRRSLLLPSPKVSGLLSFCFCHLGLHLVLLLPTVRSFGSEERPVERYVPPRDDIFEFIIFRASDIKDLIVDEPPQTLQPTLADPAIIQAVSIYAIRLFFCFQVPSNSDFLLPPHSNTRRRRRRLSRPHSRSRPVVPLNKASRRLWRSCSRKPQRALAQSPRSTQLILRATRRPLQSLPVPAAPRVKMPSQSSPPVAVSRVCTLPTSRRTSPDWSSSSSKAVEMRTTTNTVAREATGLVCIAKTDSWKT